MNLTPKPQAIPETAVPAAPRWERLRASTLGAWLAALVCIALPLLAANIGAQLWLAEPHWRDARNVLKVLALLAGYAVYVRGWERRPVHELSVAGAGAEGLAGLLLGGLLISAVVAVLASLGAYTLEAVGSLADLGAVLLSMGPKLLAGALLEELLFRLVLMRLLERSVGLYGALGLSSLVFGLAHMGNSGATPLIGLMLGLELGLLFGAAYVLTRRLWLCTALHFAWNFVQGAVFSIAVSGHTGEAWLRGSLSGPGWLSGGSFGAEGSVVAVALCLVCTAVLLRLAHGRGARA